MWRGSREGLRWVRIGGKGKEGLKEPKRGGEGEKKDDPGSDAAPRQQGRQSTFGASYSNQQQRKARRETLLPQGEAERDIDLPSDSARSFSAPGSSCGKLNVRARPRPVGKGKRRTRASHRAPSPRESSPFFSSSRAARRKCSDARENRLGEFKAAARKRVRRSSSDRASDISYEF